MGGGSASYLPKDWIDDATRRAEVGVLETARLREKWRIALSHVRQAQRAGFHIDAEVADADYGTTAGFRYGLERAGLRYAVAIRSNLGMRVAGTRRLRHAADVAQAIPDTEWQRVCWGQGTKGPLAARVARRVRLPRGRGDRWLLCERSLTDDTRKYYRLNLDPNTALADLVRLARSRWPIEQQYRELKDELGFDHFEGRTWQGWQHHSVLTAAAFTFLQLERRRYPTETRPTLPAVRMWMGDIVAILYVLGNRKLMKLLVSFERNPPLRR